MWAAHGHGATEAPRLRRLGVGLHEASFLAGPRLDLLLRHPKLSRGNPGQRKRSRLSPRQNNDLRSDRETVGRLRLSWRVGRRGEVIRGLAKRLRRAD